MKVALFISVLLLGILGSYFGVGAAAQGADEVVAADRVKFFNQQDSYWSTCPYGTGDNLKRSGCGIFALSYGLKWTGYASEQTDPQSLGDTFDYCNVPGGTDNFKLTKDASQYFGFETVHLSGYNQLGKIKEVFARGGVFSSGSCQTHIVCVVGISSDDTKLHIVDSSTQTTFGNTPNAKKYRWDTSKKEFIRITSPSEVTSPPYNGSEYWIDTSHMMQFNFYGIIPPPNLTISLSKTKLTLNIPTTHQLNVDTKSTMFTAPHISWSSNKPDVASVSSTGLIQAHKGGTAKITARLENGYTTSCTVTSTVVKVKTLKFSPTMLKLVTGETGQFITTVTPSNASFKETTWKSSNTKVATVTPDGVVTAVGFGRAYITATAIDGSKRKATGSVLVSRDESEEVGPYIEVKYEWGSDADRVIVSVHNSKNGIKSFNVTFKDTTGQSIKGTKNGNIYTFHTVPELLEGANLNAILIDTKGITYEARTMFSSAMRFGTRKYTMRKK